MTLLAAHSQINRTSAEEGITMKKLVKKDLSSKVLMIGEYFKHDAPGGMAAVLSNYDKYFEDMKFIPTWKAGSILTKMWYAAYSYVAFVWKMLFDRQIKIVHIQGAAFASFDRNMFFVYVGKKFGKKVIMHMHCAEFAPYFDPSGHKRCILGTINSCDRLFVLSSQWKEYFEGIGVDKSIITVLNNTISPPTIIKVDADPSKVKLLYLGIIGQRKGIYDLLRVIGDDATHYRKHIQLRIGGNCEEEKIKKIIKGFGIQDFVTFEGFVKGDKKTADLNWADIFVLPSYNEGLPVAILEAMSYGMPIISTNVGGIPEVVKDNVNGKLIVPGDLEAIKKSIDYYVENISAICTHGAASRELVKPFLPENVFVHLNNLYKELL